MSVGGWFDEMLFGVFTNNGKQKKAKESGARWNLIQRGGSREKSRGSVLDLRVDGERESGSLMCSIMCSVNTFFRSDDDMNGLVHAR